MASSHREGPTAARAALGGIIAYCVGIGKTWDGPLRPCGAPPPEGEARGTGGRIATSGFALLAMTGGWGQSCNKVTPMLHLCYICFGTLDFGFGVW